jgi:hypothetical protein
MIPPHNELMKRLVEKSMKLPTFEDESKKVEVEEEEDADADLDVGFGEDPVVRREGEGEEDEEREDESMIPPPPPLPTILFHNQSLKPLSTVVKESEEDLMTPDQINRDPTRNPTYMSRVEMESNIRVLMNTKNGIDDIVDKLLERVDVLEKKMQRINEILCLEEDELTD